ncbi:Sema domain-containing protein [Meloidogyne graminicola]|uniref:Sema domain-containing protein n=1 Tax=Meloidogyne graminicola TaxID=189291 RepID=A0A8S9ZYD2_9BILA|nr:Sema domain-containing protein [Meloidogyne graminicola]
MLIIINLFIFYFINLCNSFNIQIYPDNIFTWDVHKQQKQFVKNNNLLPSFGPIIINLKFNSLYVGARGNLFRLWIYNINDTSSPTLFAHRIFSINPEEKEECLKMGNSERECDFWIRQMFIKSNGDLLFCSSQSMKPQLGLVDGHSLIEKEEFHTQIGICSQHEGLNITAIYIEKGNPDNLPAIYSGIKTGLSLENQLIYRPPLMSIDGNKEIYPALRTPIYDSNWLNEPQFVGSFSSGPYIFFFFREQLTTNSNFNLNKDSVVSRVARICKSDLGGNQVLRQVWTSFVKATLNCSLNGFSFNKIRLVKNLSDDIGSNSLFYSTFIAAENTPYQSSAICVFSLFEINKVFDNSPFMEQQSGENGCWTIISSEQISTQGRRPGTCQEDSRQLSDEDLHFTKQHLLMAEQIQPLENNPIIHRGQTIFTLLVANIIEEKEKNKENKILLFVYSPKENVLFKILHKQIKNNKIKGNNIGGYLLAIYKLPNNERINSIAILPGEYIYLSNEKRVEQYRIVQCSIYGQNCINCVRDPLCSWSISRKECFPLEFSHKNTAGWLTDETSIYTCSKLIKPIELTVFPGDYLHLKCPGADNENNNIKWTFNGENIFDKYILTKNGGIVLLNITQDLIGIWTCLEDNNKLIEYSIKIDGENCVKPKSIEQFHAIQREWCRRMDNYRNNLSKWQSLYEQTNEENIKNCPIRGEKFEQQINNDIF